MPRLRSRRFQSAAPPVTPSPGPALGKWGPASDAQRHYAQFAFNGALVRRLTQTRLLRKLDIKENFRDTQNFRKKLPEHPKNSREEFPGHPEFLRHPKIRGNILGHAREDEQDFTEFMTQARKTVVSRDEAGVYHCVSRCVRRVFLCGRDAYSGKDYEHRRDWVRERLKELNECFGVEVFAYSVMSNHTHIVLRTRPDLVDS